MSKKTYLSPSFVCFVCFLFASCLLSCGSAQNWRVQVQRQASVDHRCPPKSVKILGDNGNTKARRVTLRVCGRKRVYKDYGNRKGYSSAKGPRWKQLRKRRPRRARGEKRRRREHKRQSPQNRYNRIVRRIMKKAEPRIRSCYERARSNNPNLRGAVVVRLSIGMYGQVIEAKTDVNELSQSAGSCIENHIKALKFPRPKCVMKTYHFPYHFEPHQ